MNSAEKVGAVLVVGGGVGGVQAALDLADSGFKVYMVENKPSIGGAMAQLDKTFPTNDCAMCILAPKLVAAGRHNNIQLLTNSEVTKVEGQCGNFKVTIVKQPRYVDETKCVGCGLCAQKCPKKVPNEFEFRLVERKAIHMLFPQAVPLKYGIDRNNCIYFKTGKCRICEKTCPSKAIDFEQKDEAIVLNVGAILLSTGAENFDAKLKKEFGYGYENVITSIEFERILSASGPYGGHIQRPSDGKPPANIAFIQCVGSRDEKTNPYCSAVCCMYAIKEAVIAKEHNPEIDCQLFYIDIRAYGKEFDAYYERAKKQLGIKFRKGRVCRVEELPNKNLLLRVADDDGVELLEFELVVLATGLSPPEALRKMSDVFGIELNKYGFPATSIFAPIETSRPGIFVNGTLAGPKDIPSTIAQASAAAAKAAAIIQSERGKLITIKELQPEIDVSAEKPRIGVFVCHCGINIGGVVDVPEVAEFAKSLPNVVYAEDNLYSCSQDSQERIKHLIGKHKLNRVVVASCSPRTHEPLFQNTIREAGLNPYLFEMANIRDQCSWIHMLEKDKATEKAKDLIQMAVAKANHLSALSRFEIEVKQSALVIGGGLSGLQCALELAEQGFETHLVEREAELGGNLRKLHYMLDTAENPQAKLTELKKKVFANDRIKVHLSASVESIEGCVGNFKTKLSTGVEIHHGVVIVATGAVEYKPTEYFYGKHERVLTQLEFENYLVEGKVDAKTVVMLQCVGSRDETHGYCSRVCCAEAIKNALKVKQLTPRTEVYILYRDIRTYGFREEYYKLAREQGVIFIRYDESQKPSVTITNGMIRVTVFDPILKKKFILQPEYLVLSAAILPQPDNERIAKMLKVPLSKDKFFLEAHMKLRPVDFAVDGIFLCGLAHSPKFIDECIVDAAAAAARAAVILSHKTILTEGIVAEVNEDVCIGCGNCMAVCSFNAIELQQKNRRKTAKVTPALCKGCGTCSSACHSGAIQQKGFTNKQLLSMIGALGV